MELRGYRKGDVDAMYALDVACFEEPFRFSRSDMRTFAEAENARVTVAARLGEFAGFSILHIEQAPGGCVGYIVTLDVAVEHRRAGVASALMRAMESQAMVESCGAILLHVFCENAVAIRFYERCGYVLLRTEPGFYGRGLDAQIWVKSLRV